jgi:hypothetical protein
MSVEDVRIETSKALQRREFGSETDLALGGETSASAVAAIAQAEVQARCIMAMKNPRNWLSVRSEMKAECSREEFASNKSVIYIKPIGGSSVKGLGIRFVEMGLRCMKNVEANSSMLFESDTQRIVRVKVTDLESNITHFKDVLITKTVERRALGTRKLIGTRKNTNGDTVFIVEATDDEVDVKEAAMVSKAMRTQGLRIIPGDLQDECKALIEKVRLGKAGKDPKAEQKNIADAFSQVNVSVKQLEEYLGHPLGETQPQELVDLRGLYSSLDSGEITWREVMISKSAELEESDVVQAKPEEKKGVEALKAKKTEESTPKRDTVAPPVEKPARATVPAPTKASTKSAPVAKPVAEPEETEQDMPEQQDNDEPEERPETQPEQEESPAAAEVKTYKRPLIRNVQFEDDITLAPGEKSNTALIEELDKKAVVIKHSASKLAMHFLKTPIEQLNETAVRGLLTIVENASAAKKA